MYLIFFCKDALKIWDIDIFYKTCKDSQVTEAVNNFAT